MPSRPLPLALAVVALAGCKNPRPEGPEPGPPAAELLAAFDPAALVERPEVPAAGPSAAPAVLDYGPQGRTDGGADIKVRFDRPIVALGGEDVPGLDGLIALTPAVGGRTFFAAPDLLVFRPGEELAPATTYKVRFAPGLATFDGLRVERGAEWTFETERPRVIDATTVSRGGDGERDLRRDSHVIVEFDQAVELAQVRAHLKATARALSAEDGPGRPVALRVAPTTRKEAEKLGWYRELPDDERRLYTVRAQGLWPAASEITLEVAPGLRGAEGPLPLDTPWDMSFTTYGPQAVVERACGGGPCGLGDLGLTLRNPVRAGEARKISIAPKPAHLEVEIADAYGDYPGTEVAIRGQFIPGTTYTLRVAPDLKDIYGQRFAGGFEQRVVFERRAEASLSADHGTLIPARKQTFGVETRFVRALRVRHAVLAEEDLVGRTWSEVPLPATAKQRRIELTPQGPTGWASHAIDVADLTGGARGPVLVHVEVDELAPGTAGARPETLRAMFRLTDLGPVVIGSPTTSLMQVLRLSDSAPVAGARVSLFERDGEKLVRRELGTTDRDGALTFAPAPANGRESTGVLMVVDPATGDRTTLKIGVVGGGEPDADGRRPGERTLTQVVTDRGAYRPGETVKVVGWSALDTPFSPSGLHRLAKGTAVTLTLTDPLGAMVAERAVKTSEEGKYWALLPIPAGGKLGRYKVAARLPGGQVEARVQVEDFRAPEFSVTASVAASDVLIGDRPRLRVAANYYFGGGVPFSRLTAQASCTPAGYRPPGLDATWSVGTPATDRATHHGRRTILETTGDRGYREIDVETAYGSAEHPHRCTISAEVQDASYQGVGAETGVLLHPAPFYLAIGSPQGRLAAGDRAAIPVRAVDVAGARVAAPVSKVMVVRTWHEATEQAEGGRKVFAGWTEKRETVKTCAVTPTAAGDDPRCELPALKAGSYTVTASAEAADGRKAISEARFWVSGHKQEKWVAAPAPERFGVQASASRVKPGEAVEVAVHTPWQGGRGLLVLDRRGIRDTRAFALDGKPASFRFAADDTWTPAVHVRAFAVRPLAKTRSKVRPEVERDELMIEQDAEHRRLAVRVEAPAQAGPGDRIELTAHVRDAAGEPVAGRVALWAVDEAVLALTDYAVPDLLPGFLPGREAAARAYDDYRGVILPYVRVAEDPWMASGWGYGRGAGAGFGSRGTRVPMIRSAAASVQGVPAARERFETTPVFLADIAADASGTARAKATLPDNLTTFRIFAVASARLVDGTSPGRFGVGDARTTVTTPVIVRAAAPRQLRPGDVAEVRAIVQNYTAVAGRARVELVAHDDPKTSGHELAVMSEKTAVVDVPAGGQSYVGFKVRAEGGGAAKIELRATLKDGETAVGRDAVKVALPIEAERTLTEKVAIYGSIADDRAVAIPVVLPAAVRPEVGGVSVSASSTLLGELEDAVGALLTYPYGCAEQTSSRLLPVIALAELHRTYPLGLAEDPREFVEAGVEGLLAMQTDAGGFAYWPGGQVVHPYASAYATWVLTLADRAGHKVPKDALARALDALASSVSGKDPGARWSDERLVRHAIALHVLAEVDRAEREQLDALWLRRAELPAFGRAFLLMAMHRSDPQRPEVQQLIGELTGDVQELPATAHVIERADRDWAPFFHSDGRSDAIVLAALLRARPEHALVEKLARGLLERRLGGKWRNTQENAYALVALAEYARVREAVPPDFVGRAWVGRNPVFEASFLGRELSTRSATAAMPEILKPADAAGDGPRPLTVVLQRAGQGRMYYRLGAEWAPADPSPPAREHGLALERTLRLDDGALAGRAIGVGDTVAVDLTLTAATRLRYVALDVPIPAGLEPIQLELGKGQRAATLAGARGRWVSHQELRRDRVLLFADDLPPGTHRHTVSLRATSRGEYQLPPARAEAMYMPEVWGRSAGARVAVQ